MPAGRVNNLGERSNVGADRALTHPMNGRLMDADQGRKGGFRKVIAGEVSVECHGAIMYHTNNSRQAFIRLTPFLFLRQRTKCRMTSISNSRRSRSSVFLREWRKYRQLNQTQAAERLDIDQSTLARIERGNLPYNEDFINRAALAYGCEPSDLLSLNPLKPDKPRVVLTMVRGAPEDMQDRAIEVLKAMLKAS